MISGTWSRALAANAAFILQFLGAGMLLTSCGGSGRSPTSPSTPTTPGVQQIFVASGATGLAAPGVSVTSAGVTLLSDAEGKVTFPASTGIGSAIDITSAIFLDRQTTVTARDERIFLWPRVLGPGAAEPFTARLVYTATTVGAPEGSSPLRRLPPGLQTVSIYLPPEIRTESFASALQIAIGNINAATQGSPLYQAVSVRPADSQVFFELSIDGTDPLCSTLIAFFRPTRVSTANANELFGGEINLCEARWSRESNVLTHELGHSLGLYHSGRSVDLMNAAVGAQSNFTGEERLAIALMKLRRGGNRFPDNDRAGQTSSSLSVDSVILCGK